MTDMEAQAGPSEPAPTDGASDGNKFLVLEYGLLPPTYNTELVFEQMRKAQAYRIQLQELEAERRAQYRTITLMHGDVAALSDELTQVVEQLERQREQIRLTRQRTRSRSETGDARDQTRALAERAKALRLQLKQVRKQITSDPHVREQLDASDRAASDRLKEARAHCGVYWGTYLLAEQAADQARKASKLRPVRPFRGEGRVSVQIQKGCPVHELGEDNRQIQVVPRVRADPRRGSTGRRAGQERLLRLRVQSDGRWPVWAEWPMVLHRPLPDGAIIKVATVLRRRRGPFWDWRLLLTVDVSACASRRAVPIDGAVALNLGFARRPGGALRSGYLLGLDGWGTEVLCGKSDLYRVACRPAPEAREVPATWSLIDSDPTALTWTEQSLRKADSIRSIRDKLLDEFRARFCAWRAARVDDLPAWFVERTEHAAWWRSPARFAALRRDWQPSWFEAGDEGYAMLDAWFHRDMHLFRYEAGMRSTALRDRREGYRILAAWVARRYRYLVVDDTDLRVFARSPTEESGDVEIDAVKWQQRVAAGSELRDALVTAFGPTRIRKLSSHNVTRLHAACGQLMDGLEDGRIVTCACGVQVDQDRNACVNLLRDHARNTEGPSPTPDAPAALGRAARLRQAAKARRAAKQAETADAVVG